MRRILLKILFVGLLLLTGGSGEVLAQSYAFRYVKASTGAFSNDGSSWETAKENLQNAIDELYDIIKNTSTKGYVFVEGSTEGLEYVPTRRATDESDGSSFSTSFRIYAGIYVFGGFKGDEVPDDPDHPELLPQKRIMSNGETYAEVESDINADRIGETVRRWNFKYKTVLTGSHSTTPYTFTFDPYRGIYSTTFPMNSYHVLWFGTNGKIEPTGSEGSMVGHYKGLVSQAVVDGCTIEGGYASSTQLTGHDHTGFGGGAYMVRNAMLRNCVVHHCSAMQRGGAVYMDGGGEVERCYIHTSQSTGYGMQQGYGGGVCIDYDGAVKHSYIIQCAGRIGAGLAICHVPYEYPETSAKAQDPTFVAAYAGEEGGVATPYDPFAMSTVISNCTSNAEGAGVYLDEGGTLNHCSVVNNKCIGPDVIYYGRRHGRTGGIYVRNGGTIYNSVAWGNECQVNNDVQLAAFKDGDRRINVYHSAFSKSNITDWAAVSKEGVVSLENANYPSPEYKTGNFPMFKQPTVNAGVQYDSRNLVHPDETGDGEAYQRVYNWHPLAMSDLRSKAVQVTDAVQGISAEILHAHTDVDVVGRKFESVSSCGALAHSYRNIQYALLPSVEYSEGRLPSETGNIPTLFVDPNLVTAGGPNTETETGFLDDQPVGNSWKHPMNNLPDAVYFFKQYLHDGKNSVDDDEGLTYYDIDGVHYPHVQILVKEGTISVAGQGSYVSGYARTSSIRPGSNMRLYGGYGSDFEDLDISGRDPRTYDSDLMADVLGSGFQNNSVHVVAIANQHDVIIDGFRLFGGNANISEEPSNPEALEEWRIYHSLADGAGIVVNNAMSADDKRRDMTGNILRNSVIANCAAPEGAAVYVSGGYEHGSENRLCKAELTLVNTVVRNCTAGDIYGNPNKFVAPDGTFSNMGIVVANGDGKVFIRNCDLVNNCGFPLRTDTIVREAVNHIGKIEIYNSLVFSNGLRINSDRTGITSSVFCTRESYNHITAKHVYMNYDVLLNDNLKNPANHIERVLTANKNEDGTEKHHFLDPGSGRGVEDPTDAVTVRYPTFVNPVRNVGHTEGEDQSFYGGKINYEPLPTNPIINAANTTLDGGTGILPEGTAHSMAYDMGIAYRDYGGDPDIGAIESHRLPKGGTVLYVTPDGAGRRDGSSWANAIAGNTIYALNGAGAAGSDVLDTANETTRIINTTGDGTAKTGADNGVLTTDNRYCGGFARAWFKEKRTGATTTTTVTDTWTIERIVYDDGERAGEVEILRNDASPTRTSNTVITNSGSPEGGFTAGWDDDERYPYGELSGQSRAFWRATGNYTPIPEWWTADGFSSAQTNTNSYTGETVTGIGDGTLLALINDPERGLKIQNDRTENYVGGLQYAVERAAAYNALAEDDPSRIAGVDSIQVWISNGTYTDYKGFVMRNNTTVLGSFPAKDGGTPGMNERHTLMTSVIDIPKSLSAQDLNPKDYETILQISEVNPENPTPNSSATDYLNTDAVKFWDDDYSKLTSTDTKSYQYKTRTITHHYSYYDTSLRMDKTSDYVQYGDMKNGSNNVWKNGTRTEVGDTRYYTFGTATDDKDCWHISVPKDNADLRIKAFDGTSGNIYENNKKIETAAQIAHLRDGSLTGVDIWQTLKNVPTGQFTISFDIGAYYYDNYNNLNGNLGNMNANVSLQVLDASDNVLNSIPVSFYKERKAMNRFTLSFNHATAGNVKVKVAVGPGLDRDGNEVADDYSVAMNKNINRREVILGNLKLYQAVEGEEYTENVGALTDVLTNKDMDSPQPTEVTAGTAYEVTKHRTTLRKRVLQMPDKVNPVYGGGGYFGDPTTITGAKIGSSADNVPHTERVNDSRRKANNERPRYTDPDYEWYVDATWDGFTIRHGFINDFATPHGGGAGVSMYEGGHLRNCVITNNIVTSERVKGGGVFVDGSTSSVEGCFILGNTSTRSANKYEQSQVFAGGMFMYEGTCYNTLIANNYSHSNGGGLGLCVGRFYNNTLAYNTCRLADGGGGLRIATGAESYILMANSILYGNSGLAISMTSSAAFSPFLHCYIQSETAITNNSILQAIKAPNSSSDPEEEGNKMSNGKGWKNKFENGVVAGLSTTPFEADVADGAYTGGASAANDFRLREDFSYCINKGSEDFAGTMYNALSRTGLSDGSIRSNNSYLFAADVYLPSTDVAFAERIQDCQVDIGAYEFDGTRAIEPHLYPNETPKKAVFYVTQSGAGMATAETPANAACYLKLQKVLDAAGRWRYASYKYADDEDPSQLQNNFGVDLFRKELKEAGVASDINDPAITAELENLKDYEVIVRLEGGDAFTYIPTRSTNLNTENINELEKSLIVPHGIRLEGGYESDFSKPRDILGRPTHFSGEIYDETLGTRGNVYHVITFTNDLFGINEKPIVEGLSGQLEFLGNKALFGDDQAEVESRRTVLDGLFIQDGNAHGSTTGHQQGGGAVVTEYAHVRNCVIQNNNASHYGGGLYLEPQALVSGCIVKNNQAMQGGGLYVAEPDEVSTSTYVHIISTTVVDNSATTNAGGMWFNTNLRANSSAFWRNTANDYDNVAGVFATGLTQVVENYPLNYCGVGSRRVAGVNNIELPSVANEGVRWNASMPYETSGTGEIYFPITISSVLGRAGMMYSAYVKFIEKFPTLELTDIFGLNRMEQDENEDMTLVGDVIFTKEKKNNAFIEMGARVMNGNFEVKMEYTHVLRRLFVTTTERLPTEAALALQQNTLEKEKASMGISAAAWAAMTTEQQKAVEDKVETYKQMGSSFLNPFHRLGDALDYIIKVRKEMTEKYEGDVTIGEHYKNIRFEIFVCGGTFYPFRDPHGNQGESRANTFVVPEEVTIVGGVDHQATDHNYCQETSGNVTVAGYTLNPATTHEIRMVRDHMDRNGNHVKEPWELTEQTILSGDAITGDTRTNVYHVITCFADKNQVGELPSRYDKDGTSLIDVMTGNTHTTAELLSNIEEETRDSRDQRTIIIDGVTITGGYANEIDDDDEVDNFQKLTYFRGGGILVDGNWDNTFNEATDLPEVLGVAKRNIPLMLTACLFKDNTAANGGAIYSNGTLYSFSCHFTKNLSEGPMTLTDTKYIPWAAGGAVATNYECHLWNSLFANNEAQKGRYDIIDGDDVMRTEGGKDIKNPITNANLRQGYGGVISCSETGLARIGNCDFVRNKAVAFPALYNFLDNNLRAASSAIPEAERGTSDHYYGAGHHFAVNSIFWGNEATASTVAPATGWEKTYYDALYGSGWEDLRQSYHEANFAPHLDIATLTFCAYQEGTGREGTVWWSNQDNAKAAPIKDKDGKDGLTRLYDGDFIDVLNDYFGWYSDGHPEKPYYKLDGEGNPIPCSLTDEDIMYDGEAITPGDVVNPVPYNYNLVLESNNSDPGGPYFVQPSLSAGTDGYMETADWLVARLNNSVDTGWGFLKQRVSMASESESLYNTVFQKGPDTDHLSDATPLPSPMTVESLAENYTELFGSGFYNLHSKNIYNRFKDIGYPNLMPIGDDYYMEYTREEAEGTITSNMRRISTHPQMGVQDVYIDMGIYEYQYVQLVTAGDEIDVIWVGETENEGVTCDGSTWYKATSDLQKAIETLLLSRNDHDKVIKLKGGNYTPSKMTTDSHKAFFINVPSKQDGVLLPAILAGDEVHVAKSLTIRGGYPSEGYDAPLENYENERSTDRYPVTFSMTRDIGNVDSQLEHLFIVEDAELKGTFANYLEGKNPYFEEQIMPIVFDGISFVNPYGHDHDNGGAALYYKAQYQTQQDVGTQTYYKDGDRLLKAATYTVDDTEYPVPKLLVKNCSFAASGADADVSAVKIEKGGGEALFVNTLFHSNGGAPIEAVNTRLVNCTSALNGGHIKLTDETETYRDGTSVTTYGSGIYNSIIWRDDEAHAADADKKMWEGSVSVGTVGNPSSSTNMLYNAFTQWHQNDETDAWEFYVPTGTGLSYGTRNVRLSTDNNDVLYGPNFIDPVGVTPDEGTEEEKLLAQKLSRDFRLNPSARTINQADAATYKSLVPYYAETWTEEQKTKDDVIYYFHSVQRADQTTLTDAQLHGTDDSDPPYTERELGFKVRWNGVGIDRGAYESTATIQRVLYVMDGSTGVLKDGTSWENAFDIENLQRAVDIASIYSLTSDSDPALQERAFVFVHATDYTNEALKLRDGVSVFGGITNHFDEVEEDEGRYTDPNIEAYIYRMKAARNGVATNGIAYNTVKGLVADNVAQHHSGFHLDGFWIRGGETAETPVDMSKDNTILTNDLITGNTVTTAGQPVVKVGNDGLTNNCLIYNTLIYGNTAGTGAPVVEVTDKGYMLNCTVVAPNNTASSGTMANVGNTILRDNSGTGPMFAPYLRTGANAYTPTEDHTSWQPYWYQLHEQSDQINAGTDDGNTAKSGNNTIAKLFPDYVNFDHDRDVLGNPRRLGGRVDNGCFETWKVTGNRYATNATDVPTYLTNYGGHRYPHAGSVVYVMENANLVFAVDGESNPLFTAPVRPGYVLLKQGGSIYGQGNPLSFPYVAAERTMAEGTQYSLMGFPYDVNPSGTVVVTGTTTLTQSSRASAFTPYTYDCATRAAYNFDYKEENSPLWLSDLSSIESHDTQIARTEGWLMTFASPMAEEETLRFTGWSETGNGQVYEETGGDKVITLVQHDSHAIAGTGYPYFTKLEDMGWNLKAQPWLVSTFATDGSNPNFNMDVPHLFYSMKGNGKYDYTDATAGQYYTKRSWIAGTGLDLGEGFFTQTAILDSEETLTFKQPMYSGATPEAAVKRLLVSVSECAETDSSMPEGTGDYVEVIPREGADEAMPYRLGADGLKWFAMDARAPQLYIQNTDGTPLSLVSAAPTDVEIPLGLKVGRTGWYNISLPQPEAYAQYGHVWLTDHVTHRVTDLLLGDYQLNMPWTGDYDERLTLRIGGEHPMTEVENQYEIYTDNAQLVVKGLNMGDHILVYTMDGALVVDTRASSHVFRRQLPNNTYVVRVNDFVKKVDARKWGTY